MQLVSKLVALGLLAAGASGAPGQGPKPHVKAQNGFVSVEGNKFKLDGKDFYFAGSNAYYFPFNNVSPLLSECSSVGAVTWAQSGPGRFTQQLVEPSRCRKGPHRRSGCRPERLQDLGLQRKEPHSNFRRPAQLRRRGRRSFRRCISVVERQRNIRDQYRPLRQGRQRRHQGGHKTPRRLDQQLGRLRRHGRLHRQPRRQVSR